MHYVGHALQITNLFSNSVAINLRLVVNFNKKIIKCQFAILHRVSNVKRIFFTRCESNVRRLERLYHIAVTLFFCAWVVGRLVETWRNEKWWNKQNIWDDCQADLWEGVPDVDNGGLVQIWTWNEKPCTPGVHMSEPATCIFPRILHVTGKALRKTGPFEMCSKREWRQLFCTLCMCSVV